LGLAVGISILPGCLLGLGNGLLVVKARVPAIIVSLGTASIVQSIASFVTQGAITSLGDFQTLTTIGQGMLFGVIPVPVLIFLCIALVSSILLTRTPFGAYVRAIGGNIRASKLMGIRVALNQICVYVLSGLLAAIAGIIVAGRLSMGSSQAGSGLELPAIAAAVLGGSSLSGGSGTIIGTLVGTLILSVVFNGIILIGVPFFYQFVVTGVVVLLAVALNEAIRQVT
jgi:ribose transport system permease protein